MKNIFEIKVSEELINRVNKLNDNSQPLWGKMNVAQMLAHCNVNFEMVYEDKHKKPNAFKKFILTALVKNIVVSETPYKHNGRTAPEFIIKGNRDFSIEKSRLIGYLLKTQKLGAAYFDKKESHSFGKLTKEEWNNMFYKHIDHHLKQFGR